MFIVIFMTDMIFDSKPWGTRSFINEIITRGYKLYSNGIAFDIYYVKA